MVAVVAVSSEEVQGFALLEQGFWLGVEFLRCGIEGIGGMERLLFGERARSNIG